MNYSTILVFVFGIVISETFGGQRYAVSSYSPAARASFLQSQQYSPRLRSMISGAMEAAAAAKVSPIINQSYRPGLAGLEYQGNVKGMGRPYSTGRAFYGEMYPAEAYYIPDPNTGTPITCYEPSLLSVFGYPFYVAPGWQVYGCMYLGVPPPATPPYAEPLVAYRGYYFRCPSSLNVNDQSAWVSGLVEEMCEYELYR